MKTVSITLVVAVLVGLLLAAANYLFVQREAASKPKVLLQDTYWSFSEPIPGSPELMVEAIGKYHASLKAPFDRGTLQAISPFTQLDIEYEYGVQKPNGEWAHVPVVVRVGDGSKPLTYAEILWHLHSEANGHLKTQDHHFFEGLAPKEKAITPGVPAYEVYLGS